MPREKLIVDEEAGHAGFVVTREVERTELEFAGTGPARGAYEDEARGAVAEYIPPRKSSIGGALCAERRR